ncbi:hypothetical protein BHU09_01860 [Tannerella sp. oral taxon 808]|nr:hypothetical protein BHU09_01860 [Tannerella sp. oral taxon 808]
MVMQNGSQKDVIEKQIKIPMTNEYSPDDPIDGIAPFLRDTPIEDLIQEVIESREAWLRGDRSGYTMEEAQRIAAEWGKKEPIEGR